MNSEMKEERMDSWYCDVTPSLAKRWLLMNPNNRPLREWVVNKYAGAMKRGEWRTTHQGIAFDEVGNLVDGQHRLAAIIKSGMTIRLCIFPNLKLDSYTVLDQGVARTVGDTFKDSFVSGSAGFLARLVFQQRPTMTQINEIVLFFRDTYLLLKDCSRMARARLSTGPIMAAAVVAVDRNPNRADLIVDLYNALVHFDTANPILYPKMHALIRHSIEGQRTLNAHVQFIKAIRAFTNDDRFKDSLLVHKGALEISEVRDEIVNKLTIWYQKSNDRVESPGELDRAKEKVWQDAAIQPTHKNSLVVKPTDW